MSEIKDTAVGNYSIEATRIVVDMSNEIGFLEPSANPLVVLTKKIGTEGTHNPKYEWMDNDVEVRWSEVNGAHSDSVATVNVKAGHGVYFTKGDLVKVPTTGEVFRVTNITTDALSVTRGIGEEGASAIADKATLLILGNSAMQGSGAPAENIVGVTPHFNYTQIFKTAFSVTNTLDATKLYGRKELARLRKNAGIKHAKSMEYAFLFGNKSLDVSGAQPISTTEGIMTTLASNANNVSKASASVKEADLIDFCKKVFTYGGDSRVALSSPSMLAWITGLASDKLKLVQSQHDKTYGLNINKILTPFGVLNLVMHPLLINSYDNHLVALSMDDVKFKPLTGRDTKLMTNIQARDEDGQRDMFLTEAGIQMKLPLKHGIFKITAV